MKIQKLSEGKFSIIKPMWENLNQIHGANSTHFKAHFSSFRFEERIRQIKVKDSFAIYVAQDQDQPIGYCIASVDDSTGEIDSIYVYPEYQKKNIGKRLIIEAENWLKKSPIKKIHIAVAEGNESVFGFYDSLDYKERFTILEKKA